MIHRPRCGIGQGQTRECGDDSFGHKQEYTVDVFNACKMETRVFSAFLTILKTNGGFGFDNGEDNRGTQLLINCMASYGFTFPTVAVGPIENSPAVADVPQPALVNKAGDR